MTGIQWGMVTSCVMIAFGCGGRHIDSRSQTESGHDAGIRRTGAGGSCATRRCADCEGGACIPMASGGKPSAGGAGAARGAGGADTIVVPPDASVDGGPMVAACPVVVPEDGCERLARPIVYVHGTYGAGDEFAHVAALLESNGFCFDRIVAVEYDSLGDQPGTSCSGEPAAAGCGRIDSVIKGLLAADSAVDGVILVCHSQGTAHCGTYLHEPAQAAKVPVYVNLSGSPDVGDVETLSISSQNDLGGTPHHATGTHVTTVTLKDENHTAIAASTRTFQELYRYLARKEPRFTQVQCGGETVTVQGLSETFADNVPVPGTASFAELGTRPRGPVLPAIKAPIDEKGQFRVQLKRNVAYEVSTYDTMDRLLGYHYFTPFKRSDGLVRLIAAPSASDGSSVGGVIAQSSTDKVVSTPETSVFIARWTGGSFRQDLGAQLTIDGHPVLTDGNAGRSANQTTVLTPGVAQLFMYDANSNGRTDLGLVDSGPFMAFTDVYVGTTPPRFVDMTFTPGTADPGVSYHLTVSNWASLSPNDDHYAVRVVFEH